MDRKRDGTAVAISPQEPASQSGIRMMFGCVEAGDWQPAAYRRGAAADASRSQGQDSEQCGTARYGIRAVSSSHDQPR